MFRVSGINPPPHSPPPPQKKILIFQEMELSYISGNGSPKKLLIFQEVTFRARKMKKKKKHSEKISYISGNQSF